MKAEGKLLTAKQKQDKARAQAMLDSLRAQGIELPEVGEKRAVRPGTRVRQNKKKDTLQQSQSQDDSIVDDTKADGDESVVESVEPVVEKIKEAWDASSSEDESEEIKKDEVSVKTETAKKPTADSKKTAAKKIVVQESDDSDESDDDSNEDDDDDDEDDGSEEESSEEENKTDAEVKKDKAFERIKVSSMHF